MIQILKLNSNEVKQAIADYVEKNYQYNVIIDDITLAIGEETRGFGPGERDVITFKEAIVSIER